MIHPTKLRHGDPALAAAEALGRVEEPLQAVEREMERILETDNPFLHEVSTHLLRSGGKRLRPALLLLSGEACGLPPEQLVSVAAALECVHMATLVHDDVVDGASLRRGVPPVHRKWGNHVGVLTGDYLFATAFGLLARVGDNRVVQLMAKVVLEMSAGEIEQQRHLHDLDQTPDDYLRRIYQKTGCFIAECTRLAAVVAGAGREAEDGLCQFGYGVGMGFQIIDDVLDFTSAAEALGKPAAGDLRAGILTLPVLYALNDPDTAAQLRSTLAEEPWGDHQLDAVYECLEESGAILRSRELAQDLTARGRAALQVLPAGAARDALDSLAQALVDRLN